MNPSRSSSRCHRQIRDMRPLASDMGRSRCRRIPVIQTSNIQGAGSIIWIIETYADGQTGHEAPTILTL